MHGSWLKDAFTITSVWPSFFFGSPLYTLPSSIILNSSLSSRTYLFSSFEKRSPKSNKSQNVPLACAILKCVNSLISVYVNLQEMSLVPNTLYLTAFIDQRKLIPHSRKRPIFYTPCQKVCKLKQPCFFKKDISLFVRLIHQINACS